MGGVVDLAEGNKTKARTTWLLQIIVTRWLLVELTPAGDEDGPMTGQSGWLTADGGWRKVRWRQMTRP